METLSKHKKAFIIGMCLLCAVLAFSTIRSKPAFLADFANFFVMPMQSAFSEAGNWIDDRISFVASLEHLYAENRELREQNAALLEENQRLGFMKDENQKLSELLAVDQLYADYPKVGARIIGHGVNDWYDMYTIDKGTN
ncbi:MAG: rod shape-determining protein MreC, partial [Clostridiales bacterium]|nr:rod shape-determining protein MreC [Clostridiales bacterium]